VFSLRFLIYKEIKYGIEDSSRVGCDVVSASK
jgi:hypothetical protein